jgi:hypothetical protein
MSLDKGKRGRIKVGGREWAVGVIWQMAEASSVDKDARAQAAAMKPAHDLYCVRKQGVVQFGLSRSDAVHKTGLQCAAAAAAEEHGGSWAGVFEVRDGSWLVAVRQGAVLPDGDLFFDASETALEALRELLRRPDADPAPARSAVEEFLEAAHFAILGSGIETRLCGSFQCLDMAAQRRGRRDAEDEFDAVCPAPVDDLGSAIMAIGTQQDGRLRPVGTDRAQEAAQQGSDLFAVRPLRRTQHGGDETTVAVEHDNRLKAVLVVMGVEETQLLAAMHGVERVVDVEHDPFRHLPEGGAIEIDHGAAHTQQGARIRQVLQPRDGRLRTQRAARRQLVERHLEHRIAAQAGCVVAVFVAGGDHQQAKADDIGKIVNDLLRRAPILEAGGQSIGDTKVLFHLSHSEDAGVRRQEAAIEASDHGLATNR